MRSFPLLLAALALPLEAFALSSFDSSSHALNSRSIVFDNVIDSLPGTDLTQFDDSVSTSDTDFGDAFASNTTSLSYGYTPNQIVTAGLVDSSASSSDGFSTGNYSLTLTFDVASTVDYTADGLFQATGSTSAADDGQASWNMLARLEGATTGLVFEETLVDFFGETQNDFLRSGTLLPDTYTLTVTNSSFAQGHDFQFFSVSIDASTALTLQLVPEPAAALLLATLFGPWFVTRLRRV